jgi:hypothetical protein
MCSLLSLLLCALTVAWWTQSQGQVDQLTFEHTGSHAIRLWGSNGKLLVTRTVVPADYTKPIRFARDPQESNPLLLATSFSYASQPARDIDGGTETNVVVPAWLLASVFSILPLTWITLKLRRRAWAKKIAQS